MLGHVFPPGHDILLAKKVEAADARQSRTSRGPTVGALRAGSDVHVLLMEELHSPPPFSFFSTLPHRCYHKIANRIDNNKNEPAEHLGQDKKGGKMV